MAHEATQMTKTQITKTREKLHLMLARERVRVRVRLRVHVRVRAHVRVRVRVHCALCIVRVHCALCSARLLIGGGLVDDHLVGVDDMLLHLVREHALHRRALVRLRHLSGGAHAACARRVHAGLAGHVLCTCMHMHPAEGMSVYE